MIAITAAMAATTTPAIVPWDQPLLESAEGVDEEDGILLEEDVAEEDDAPPGEDVDEGNDRPPEDGDDNDGDKDGAAAETSGQHHRRTEYRRYERVVPLG